MVSAKLLLDSINATGDRLTTWVLKYPRFIHAEIMTHRMLSKNSASSRAIPSSKMIRMVIDEPAMPEFWGENQSGMQATNELSPEKVEQAKAIWLNLRDNAITGVQKLLELGVHKQLANRPLEPWYHITVLCSGTDWQNFFALRAHPDAQPEFQKLAFQMLDLYNRSIPTFRNIGEWHIPFADEALPLEERLKVATARAARVSYLNFEGEIDIDKDFELYDRLTTSGHFSPTEHAAMATPGAGYVGNFKGWLQHRKTIVGENRKDTRIYGKE